MRRALFILLLVCCQSTAFADADLAVQGRAEPEQSVITNKQTSVELLAIAKKILAEKGVIADAIEALNAILLMPMNPQTMEAQELIGYAREAAGMYDRAKVELKLYLTLFPTSARFKIVQEHLIALEISEPMRLNKFDPRKPHQGNDSRTSGSISSYYYIGSTSASLLDIKPNTTSIISNGRADGFFRSDEYTTKLQIRYSRSDNLSVPSVKERLSTAMVEVRNTYLDYGFKLGRMTGGVGVLGPFDGAVINYSLTDKTDVTGLIGVPIILGSDSKRMFVGAALTQHFADASYTLYVNNQTADGIAERQAVGVESSYFKNELSLLGTLEYDTLYGVVNTLLIHGNYRGEKTSPYFLYEKRKSPVLYAERATILGFGTLGRRPFSSVGDVFSNSGLTADQIYSYINQSTPMSTSMVIGTITPLSDKWSLGTDVQITNIAPVDVGIIVTPTLDLPEYTLKQPGSGDSVSLNTSLYGTEIFGKGTSTNLLLSLSRDDVSSSYAVTTVHSFSSNGVRYELLGRYAENNMPYSTSTNLMLSVRLNYQIKNNLSIDTALSVVKTDVDFTAPATPSSSTFNQTFYAGIRMDF